VTAIIWQPSTPGDVLRLRADMLAAIRSFFAERSVLEVETPVLCHATGTDPQLDFFSTRFHSPPENPALYLQTSPEFAMKRLLAAGSGDIYQICKAFRNAESGRLHNPEFTILEWYRLDFSLSDLMRETTELIQHVLLPLTGLTVEPPVSYQQIFLEKTGLDPLVFDLSCWRDFARQQGFPEALDLCGKNESLWLDFIFSHLVQPQMAKNTLYLVYDYPAIQSSLARIKPEESRVAERFEVFFGSIELGNGFRELTDAAEQARRFDQEIRQRKQLGLPVVEKDVRFLAALAQGLPECSGIAIGLDRLLMVLAGKSSIDEVLSFPVARA
jgi:lysyl-tRNA synthetase class 2